MRTKWKTLFVVLDMYEELANSDGPAGSLAGLIAKPLHELNRKYWRKELQDGQEQAHNLLQTIDYTPKE